MAKFNPGDIAITTRHALAMTKGNPVIEAGSQVELIARGEAGEEFTLGSTTYRLKAAMWFVGREGMRTIVAERHLVPLRGYFLPASEKAGEIDHNQKLHAGVM